MRIILGVSGSIAAYKAAELCRLLVKDGHEVAPIVTAGAERFVSQQLFDALARREAVGPYPHLERADLLVVAPASANTVAKLAQGLASDLLSETALAHQGPLLLAPAMSTRMWAHAAVAENVRLLRERGALIVGPAEGDTAEGEEGVGRMAEPAEILAAVRALAPNGDLAGKRVLVTAGGTRERLDLVRFLGNRSSGKMGLALVREAGLRGAAVTLVAANVESVLLEPLCAELGQQLTLIEVESAAELEREVLITTDACDVVLMAAAISDYRPQHPLAGKRTKGEPWTVELEPTTDVLATLSARRRSSQILVGFGAESGAAGLERKRRMRLEKGLDLVVYNDVGEPGIGFENEENAILIISAATERAVSRRSKQEVAELILDAVAALLTTAS